MEAADLFLLFSTERPITELVTLTQRIRYCRQVPSTS
ncbi:hypothetical protein PEC106568_37500 [Pectobacterium carotovorum subsp. carotovorum]|nr:hypothetical protein PEC106568_37500 [Pectobacterium carotovorum subsp. carotovorum]